MATKIISSNGGYHIAAEVRTAVRPDNTHQLRFLSQYDHSGDPEESRVKFEIILTNSELKDLADLIYRSITS